MATPLDPVKDWETLRATPEGTALVDAYLTLRSELNTLISYCQAAERGAGMSVERLREHAETLIPLLSEPYGYRWTADYFERGAALYRVISPLREHVNLAKRDKHHDWLVPEALAKLEKLNLPAWYGEEDEGERS